MHCQARDDFLSLWSIARFFPPPDPAMQVRALRRRHSFIDHFLIERMGKPITFGYRPIRPALLSTRPQDQVTPRQACTQGLCLHS